VLDKGTTDQSIVQTGEFAVPAADSADNVDWGDVIGSKLDTVDGDSLYALVTSISHSIESERLVYPTLANGATVVSANVDWTFGAYATVVPAATIASDFHVLGLVIEACDRDAVFQLELYRGAGDDLITAIRFAVQGGFFGNQVYIVGSEHIDANDRIRARLASSNGTAQIATIALSIVYFIHV
jgi:hypothetical protein